MIQPINYGIPQTNLFAGANEALGVLGKVAQFSQVNQQKKQDELKNTLMVQRELEYKKDFRKTVEDPNPKAIATLSLKYPERAKAMEFGLKSLTEEQKQNNIK